MNDKVLGVRVPRSYVPYIMRGDDSNLTPEQIEEVDNYIEGVVHENGCCGIPVAGSSLGPMKNTNDINMSVDEPVFIIDFPKLYDRDRRMIVHSDSGHSWLRVPAQMLIDLDITESISSCSYLTEAKQSGGQKVMQIAYLEEDLDMGVFVDAMRDKWRIKVVFTVRECKGQPSVIRQFPRYNPANIWRPHTQ